MVVGDLYPALERDYLINRKRTFRNIENVWENHLKPFFAVQEVTPFRPSRVQEYILMRLRGEASNATINRELAALKRMASLAILNYETDFDDAQLVASLTRWSKIKALPEENVREQQFPDELYDAFALETAREGLWFRTMFELAYRRGWRPKSLKDLKVSNVDLTRQTIRLTAKQTKNKRPVEIAMLEFEYELVKQCAQGKKPDDYLLTREKDALGRASRSGGHIVDYRDAWKRVCERVGVEAGRDGLIFYDVKRGSITNLIDSGVDVKDAMRVTGHLTESAFRRYQQVPLEKMREVSRKIEQGHRDRQRRAKYQQAELFLVDPIRKPS
jgi:site-specific recombinase XerD